MMNDNKRKLAEDDQPPVIIDTFNCLIDYSDPSRFVNDYLNNYRVYMNELCGAVGLHSVSSTGAGDGHGVTPSATRRVCRPVYVDNIDEDKKLWERIVSTRRFWSADDASADENTGTGNGTTGTEVWGDAVRHGSGTADEWGTRIEVIESSQLRPRANRGRSYKKSRDGYRQDQRGVLIQVETKDNTCSEFGASGRSRQDIYDWLSNIQNGTDDQHVFDNKAQDVPDAHAFPGNTSDLNMKAAGGSTVNRAARSDPRVEVLPATDGHLNTHVEWSSNPPTNRNGSDSSYLVQYQPNTAWSSANHPTGLNTQGVQQIPRIEPNTQSSQSFAQTSKTDRGFSEGGGTEAFKSRPPIIWQFEKPPATSSKQQQLSKPGQQQQSSGTNRYPRISNTGHHGQPSTEETTGRYRTSLSNGQYRRALSTGEYKQSPVSGQCQQLSGTVNCEQQSPTGQCRQKSNIDQWQQQPNNDHSQQSSIISQYQQPSVDEYLQPTSGEYQYQRDTSGQYQQSSIRQYQQPQWTAECRKQPGTGQYQQSKWAGECRQTTTDQYQQKSAISQFQHLSSALEPQIQSFPAHTSMFWSHQQRQQTKRHRQQHKKGVQRQEYQQHCADVQRLRDSIGQECGNLEQPSQQQYVFYHPEISEQIHQTLAQQQQPDGYYGHWDENAPVARFAENNLHVGHVTKSQTSTNGCYSQAKYHPQTSVYPSGGAQSSVVSESAQSPSLKFDDEVWYINGVPHQHARPLVNQQQTITPEETNTVFPGPSLPMAHWSTLSTINTPFNSDPLPHPTIMNSVTGYHVYKTSTLPYIPSSLQPHESGYHLGVPLQVDEVRKTNKNSNCNAETKNNMHHSENNEHLTSIQKCMYPSSVDSIKYVSPEGKVGPETSIKTSLSRCLKQAYGQESDAGESTGPSPSSSDVSNGSGYPAGISTTSTTSDRLITQSISENSQADGNEIDRFCLSDKVDYEEARDANLFDCRRDKYNVTGRRIQVLKHNSKCSTRESSKKIVRSIRSSLITIV